MIQLENGILDLYLQNTDHIRYLTFISDGKQGKKSLLNSLVTHSGVKLMQVNADYMPYGREETNPNEFTTQDPCYILYRKSTESAAISHYFIHVLNSDTSTDRINDLIPTLRLSDGAVIIVDITQGVTLYTEAALRKALTERLKPVLFINKLDIPLFDTQADLEELYQSIYRIVDHLNRIISTYQDKVFKDLILDPIEGNIIFGCGYLGWGFNLQTIARIYSKRFNMNEKLLVRNLWGDKFYDPVQKKFLSSSSDSIPRTFIRLCLEPIKHVHRIISQGNSSSISKICTSLKLELPPNFSQLTIENLHRFIMKSWMNLSDALLDTAIFHLPSPVAAQKYRIDYLFTGQRAGVCATGMRNCDKDSPLMIYVTKKLNTLDKQQISFGRVFSGTLESRQAVVVLGSNYNEETHDFYRGCVDDYFTIHGNRLYKCTTASGIRAGHVIALNGSLTESNSCTVTDFEAGYGFKSIPHNKDSPCIRCTIQPENSEYLHRIQEELDNMASGTNLIRSRPGDPGTIIIESTYLAHIESAIELLKKTMPDLNIFKSAPQVIYKETALGKNYQLCQAISKNSCNRVTIDAEGLNIKLVQKMEQFDTSTKSRALMLVNKYGWNSKDVKKIMSYGFKPSGSNILICQVPITPEINAVKESVISAFQSMCEKGCLCEEEIRGVKFDIGQIDIHPETSKRNKTQIGNMISKALKAAFLSSVPALVEPFYSIEIHCNNEKVSAVCESLTCRRAVINECEQFSGSSLTFIRGLLPVSESFSIQDQLKVITSGQCFTSFEFDSWNIVPGSPYDLSSTSYSVITTIRSLKSLTLEIPSADQFIYDPYAD